LCFSVVERGTCFRATAGGPSDADAAWKALQQAAALPEQKHNDEQIAADALAASKQANSFYTQFPNSSNALAAKILECKLLQTAYFHGDKVFAKWANAEANLVPNSGLSAEERYDLRLPVLRELIKRFPGKEKPYAMLLSLAAMSPDDKARPIANEILTDPVSDALKDKARALLRRLNEAGKPLDVRFTAIDGRQVDLNQMKGKVVLIDFWATWCVSCVEEIPLLKECYQKFHSRGFEIVGISFDTNEKTLDNFVQKRGLPWPQYFGGQGPQNKFRTEFFIEWIPTLWLVDKKGNLRETDASSDLKGKIEKLLAE
jgi:thiol-disulfide isomerase/thioredoxin